MKTTYEKIKSFRPCSDGWKKLLENTNPEMNMTAEIDLMDILRSNGIKDAVWALRCWDYMDWCLFICDVCESILPIFEKKYPEDDRPRKALQAIKACKAGTVAGQAYYATAADAAYAAADDACAAADAVADAAAYAVASAAADAAAYAAADDVTYAAADAAVDAVAVAADDAYAAADDAAADDAACYARKKKWEEIERIFIKHFENF